MNAAAPSRSPHSHSSPTTPGALRVPEVAIAFWVVKALSTAMGESTSDALVNSSLGASIADGLAKPKNISGLDIGDGPVAIVLAALIALLVAYLAVTKKDVQRSATREEAAGTGPMDPAVPATTPQR